MEVVEYYRGASQWQNSPPVRIEGLPTARAADEISEINIGGKFFEDRQMLRSTDNKKMIRVLRFLQQLRLLSVVGSRIIVISLGTYASIQNRK